MGSPQEKPKRLRLVVDVSGSMYRFNGHDGRLEREMEAMLMVMEALEGYEDKIQVILTVIMVSGEQALIDKFSFKFSYQHKQKSICVLFN